jgi:O-antigen/teichoic acid export membrane protein
VRKIFKSITISSLIFFILSGITSLLNYAFYPIIAHSTDTATFGEIQFFITLLNQFGVGFMVLNIISLIITVVQEDEKKRNKELGSLKKLSNLVISIIAVLGAIVLIICRPIFHIDSVWPIIALGASLLAHIPYTIELGRLQGENQYVFSGIVGIVASTLKVILAVVLIFAGFGATGAIVGYALGLVLAYVISSIKNRRFQLPRRPTNTYLAEIKTVLPRKNLLLATLFTIAIITTLSTIDIVIAKASLSEVGVGEYAGISTITKIILAVATPLLWLVVPHAVNNNMSLVRKYFAITVALVTVGSIFCLLFRDFITKTIFNMGDSTYLSYLPWALLSASLFACITFLALVSLCNNQLKLTTVVSIILVCVFTATFYLAGAQLEVMFRTILAQIISALVAAVVLLWWGRLFRRSADLAKSSQ